MSQLLKRILYFLLGLCGLLAVLCAVAAPRVTSAALMKEGFLRFSQTAHLNVSPTRYGEYADAISQYLEGKSDLPRVTDGDGAPVPAFSDKENAHLRDVRALVRGLQWARWLGCGGVALILVALYFFSKDRPAALSAILRGFVGASAALLLIAAALGVWGMVNFQGLFWAFHQAAFTNDLWLLNPQTDLLMALMPLPFFTWYAGELLKSLLPVLAVMLLVIVAYFKTKDQA